MGLRPPRRRLLRGLLGAVVLLLLLSGGVLTLSYDPPELEAGTMASPANGSTVVATQGWNARNTSLPDRPDRLVSVGPTGGVEWVHDGPASTRNWFYDVDPLPDGNLLVVNPVPNATVVYEFDPERGERLWTERFERPDVHDVDLLDGGELLVAGIDYGRNATSGDSVFVYNRTRDAITWKWRFVNHYPDDAGPGVDAEDWTHVNDVDPIGEGKFLVSVRNLDQVIVIDRATKAIEMRLGRDDEHGTLYEQHNPTRLDDENGTPTILVADSENDRIVEYERTGGPPGEGTWERVWTLSGGLNWPRDADRLPNGNTLVVDSMNHRVIEVTPTGEVVWEMYVPWATYDAERVVYGDEPGGPTMDELGVTGNWTVTGEGRVGTTGLPTVPAVVGSALSGTPVAAIQSSVARVQHVTPWIKPRWLPTWGFLAVAAALLVGAVWALGEAVHQRRRVSRAVAALPTYLRARVRRTE
jgi:hypothetical protein